eukprot:369808_1
MNHYHLEIDQEHYIIDIVEIFIVCVTIFVIYLFSAMICGWGWQSCGSIIKIYYFIHSYSHHIHTIAIKNLNLIQNVLQKYVFFFIFMIIMIVVCATVFCLVKISFKRIIGF